MSFQRSMLLYLDMQKKRNLSKAWGKVQMTDAYTLQKILLIRWRRAKLKIGFRKKKVQTKNDSLIGKFIHTADHPIHLLPLA